MYGLSKNPFSLPCSAYGGVGKGLFMGLLSAACAVVLGCIGVIWLIPVLGVVYAHPLLQFGFYFVGAGLVLWLLFFGFLTAYQAYTGCGWGAKLGIRSFVMRQMLRLMIVLGGLVGIDKQRVRLSFIKINNELVLASRLKCEPERLLVLLPHCVQQSKCTLRLHTNIYNCRRCGVCPVGSLLDMADALGVHIFVASGGTPARLRVTQLRPRVIVAVACERDLTSGIQDAYPVSVYGCLNVRPNGPCIDTSVNVDGLAAVVRNFLAPSPSVVPDGSGDLSASVRQGGGSV